MLYIDHIIKFDKIISDPSSQSLQTVKAMFDTGNLDDFKVNVVSELHEFMSSKSGVDSKHIIFKILNHANFIF